MEDDLHSNGENLSFPAENDDGNIMAIPMECESQCGTGSPDKNNGCMVVPHDYAASPSSEVFVYRQDIVRCHKYEDMLGIVVEVAGDSDSEGDVTDVSDLENDETISGHDNSEDSGKNDGHDRNESLCDGQVRVTWTDTSETTESLRDIAVIDREFLHGDIVASVSNPTGQLGLVTDVNITVDLLSPTAEMIKNVSSKNLRRVRDFTAGDYVVYGPWLGRVDDVLDNVTVLFDDGSVCKVMKADPLRLKPISKSIIADAGYPYYPGQRVRAVSSSVFKTSRWLSGLWKANRIEGTVTKVHAASVFVYWIASASLGSVGSSSMAVPSEEQNPKKLTLLSCFAHANWQLGDWCLLPPSQLFQSSSVDSSASKCVEDSGMECNHDSSILMEHFSNDNNVVQRSSEDTETGYFIPVTNQKDEHEPGGMDSGKVIQCKGYMPANYVVSFNDLTMDSRLTVDVNEASVSGENKLSACPDANSSSSEVGDTTNSVTKNVLSVPSPSTSLKEAAYRRKLRKVLFRREKKSHKKEEPFERAYFIASTTTKVDVAWQDGSREFGLQSKSLIPIQSPGDHEFFPEQYVVEKAANEGDDSFELRRVGVVENVNAKERTVYVKWLKPVSSPEGPREFDNKEVVSAYELAEHPDYDYCYGDLVVRLSPYTAPVNGTIMGDPVKDENQIDPPAVTEDVSPKSSGYETNETAKDEADTSFSSLSWVGHITGLEGGDIEVTWADGMISMVGPQAIYVVGREDGESFNGGSEVSDDGASWETVEENEMAYLDAPYQDADSQPPADNVVESTKCTASSSEDSNAVQSDPLSIPLAAFGFFTRLASGIFSRGRKETDSSCTDEDGTKEAESQDLQVSSLRETNMDEHSSQDSDLLDGQHAENAQDTEEICNSVEVEAEAKMKMEANIDNHTSEEMDIDNNSQKVCYEHSSCSSKHFDIVRDPLDHHFLGQNPQGTCGRNWIKKVQKEWSILEKNLPDKIFVRAYEERMDLLRAVMVGASGTPYQDGLFFFDFHLPPEYPQVPPSAYYHSGGLRINPNLYEEGKVCLSLLNTWTGKGNEVWDPNSSSILQVLVSIQGLVLNSRPYFNEAGYEKQVGTAEGEKNSLPYNENTYLLNLRSMLFLLRRPPMHFEEFVKDHFRRRGRYILKACDAYMKGCLVGSLTSDACVIEKNSESSSAGFKLILAKLIPKLVVPLMEVGADCQEFQHMVKP